jgi:hypothetical protein
MAGDWIKLEHTTPDKPEVVQMAARLNIDQDAVVGKLVRIWVWADQNSLDGNALTVTDAFLDRVTACPGFAGALREVGWLSGRQGLLTIPNFDRHNGQTAKARAVTNRRVSRHRAKSGGNAASVTDVTPESLQKPLPEKRREEDNPPKAPQGAAAGKTSEGDGSRPLPKQVYPPALAASAEFVACWEGEWLPYLLQRKDGRLPAMITLDRQLGTCLKLGPAKAVLGLRSAIDKGWAAPDENPSLRNNVAAFPLTRPWDEEPEGWKAWWRNEYPPENFADAPRYEDGLWKEIPNDHRKMIWEGLQKNRRAHA